MESHTTVIIPFKIASSSLACSTVPNSPFVFPKLPKLSTRSPGLSSGLVAEASESGGLLARSESGIAPACDSGGWGALGSLRYRLAMNHSVFFPRVQSIALRLFISSIDCRIALARMVLPSLPGQGPNNSTALIEFQAGFATSSVCDRIAFARNRTAILQSREKARH